MAKSKTTESSAPDIKQYEEDFLHKLLREMLLIRRFEEKAAQMYGLRKIGGFCHLYNGQEAVGVGAVAGIDLSKDYILTAYRDHGHALACGMDPKAIMAELYGKITGCSRGKGGSMHMFDVEKHMLGGNGIVGAQIPIATGVGFAAMYRKNVMKEKDTGAALCFFGDGAIHQGAFHESLNLAKIWNIPVVYIVENNHFGMGTSVKRISSVQDFDVKAVGYGLPGDVVDGMDVLSVYEAIKEAADRARSEGTACLLDIKTYRYKGHSMSDPAKYRTREELEAYQEQDPIQLLRVRMDKAGMIDDKAFDNMDEEIKTIVQESVDFAEESDQPGLETLYEDIYVEQ